MSSRSGLQYMEATGQDEFGVAIDLPSALDRREVKSYTSGGAITAGDWVMLDTSASDSARVLTVVRGVGLATGGPLVVGVSLSTAAGADEQVQIVVRGYVEGASVANAVAAAGVALMVDAAVAGRAVALTAGALSRPCGVSLEAAAGNVADVFVYGIDV